MIDWVIGMLIAAAVVGIVIKKMKDRRLGKSGCGCNCSGCHREDRCKERV